MSWSPEDDDDWKPNRPSSGLCYPCDVCNPPAYATEDPAPLEQWEVTEPKDLP